MAAPPQDERRFRVFHAKATGITALAGVLVLVLSSYLLSRRAGVIVGGLALFVTVVAGAQSVFQTATLASHALQGQRRRQFQVWMSLGVLVLFWMFLVSRVDGVPVETLQGILTPWLVVPLGIIATVSWYAGGALDREHPFRGFVVAATVLAVLCWFWTAGMTSGDSDYEDGGSSLYLDRERAQRARATGEYVWRYLIYVSVAYAVLFYRWWKPVRLTADEAFGKLNETLTQDAVDAIVARMSQYIVERNARHGRSTELPFPQAALEMAYLKAIISCADPQRLGLLKATYITLDDYFLSDEDCAALDAWDKVTSDVTEGRLSDMEAATWLSGEVAVKAQEVRKKLSEGMHRRSKTVDTLRK